MRRRCIDGRGKDLGPLVQRLMLFGGSPASRAGKFILIFLIVPDLLIFKISIKNQANRCFLQIPRISHFWKIKNLEIRWFQGFSSLFRAFGGDKRDRTADLLNAIQALSQAVRKRTPMFWKLGCSRLCVAMEIVIALKGFSIPWDFNFCNKIVILLLVAINLRSPQMRWKFSGRLLLWKEHTIWACFRTAFHHWSQRYGSSHFHPGCISAWRSDIRLNVENPCTLD